MTETKRFGGETWHLDNKYEKSLGYDISDVKMYAEKLDDRGYDTKITQDRAFFCLWRKHRG